MRKEDLHNMVVKHWNKIKVFWWVFAIIVMLLAVKTYVNYSTITDEIEKINNNIESTNQEIAYSEKFYSKYLDSDYAMYFLSHKNNILFDWEYIIKISTTPKEIESTWTDVKKDIQESPQESWKRFLKSKLN